MNTVTCLGLLISLPLLAYSAQARNEKSVGGAPAAMDKTTNACNAAYSQLQQIIDPKRLDEYLSEPMTVAEELAFRNYDTACLRGLDETLDPNTAPFLRDILGVFGYLRDRTFNPFCTAFRVATNRFISPAHCWCESLNYSQVTFRVLEAPSVNLQVRELAGAKPICPVGDDYSDVVLIDVDGASAPFDKSEKDFSGPLEPGMQIAVFGLDEFRLQRLGANASETWPNAITFSPVSGSRKFAASWLHPPPSAEQYSNCLYYRAPTYPGMSGALILGAESDRQPHPGRLFVAGMHLRRGEGGPRDQCGSYSDINIGRSFPPSGMSFPELQGHQR